VCVVWQGKMREVRSVCVCRSVPAWQGTGRLLSCRLCKALTLSKRESPAQPSLPSPQNSHPMRTGEAGTDVPKSMYLNAHRNPITQLHSTWPVIDWSQFCQSGLALCRLLATAASCCPSCPLYCIGVTRCWPVFCQPMRGVHSDTAAIRSCFIGQVLIHGPFVLPGLWPKSTRCYPWRVENLDKLVRGFGSSGPLRNAWPPSCSEPCHELPLATRFAPSSNAQASPPSSSQTLARLIERMDKRSGQATTEAVCFRHCENYIWTYTIYFTHSFGRRLHHHAEPIFSLPAMIHPLALLKSLCLARLTSVRSSCLWLLVALHARSQRDIHSWWCDETERLCQFDEIQLLDIKHAAKAM